MKRSKIYTLLLAGILVCSYSCKKSSVGDTECRPSFDPVVPVADELSIILLGDQGCGNDNAKRVADLMEDYAAKNDVSFVMGVGDNIYQNGADNVNDVRFKTHFESIFYHDHLDIPFYLVLGNHDYEGSVGAQIGYSKVSQRWTMPSEYYTFNKFLPGGEKISFFGIDTYELENSSGTQQLEWLATKLNNASDAKWRIVFGHHPMYNNGNYGDQHKIIEKLAPLFEKYKVNLYAAGHEHNIQYLEKKQYTNYIVTGSGCKVGLSECKENTIYNVNQLGFSGLKISANRIVVESVIVDKGVDFAYVIQ